MRKSLVVAAGIAAVLLAAAYAKSWWPFKRASKTELPTLKPSTARHAELLLPDLDGNGDPAVEVDVWVPRDYEVSLSDGNEIVLRSRADSRALDIEIHSSWTAVGAKPSTLLTPTCGGIDIEGGASARVIRSEDRPDGWLALCRAPYKTNNGGEFSYTYVVRDVRWANSDAQCVIRFHDDDDPSPARLADAIAVCDSMKLREPTKRESEAEIWAPDGSGLRGVRPIKPERRLRGNLVLDGGVHATAEVLAPTGYRYLPSSHPSDAAYAVTFVRPNSPSIDVRSGWPDAPRFGDRQCGGLDVVMEPKSRVVRTEDRSDGWMTVCELQEGLGSDQSPDDTVTEVVRDMHWNGAEVQCVVMFRHNDRATPARVTDAISICDGIHLEKAAPGARP